MKTVREWITYTMPLAGLITTIGVIVLGIVDLVFVLFTGAGTSVSNFLINVGFASPVFVFAVGFTCGHLFGGMTPEKPQATEDFWPIYLSAHKHLSTRILHAIGTLLGLVIFVIAILTHKYWAMILAPITSYAIAWNTHLWIEYNTPETFSHPLKSFLCDLRLTYELITLHNP